MNKTVIFAGVVIFINNQFENDALFKQELLEHLKHIEEEYIGGSMSESRAKESLSQF